MDLVLSGLSELTRSLVRFGGLSCAGLLVLALFMEWAGSNSSIERVLLWLFRVRYLGNTDASILFPVWVSSCYISSVITRARAYVRSPDAALIVLVSGLQYARSNSCPARGNDSCSLCFHAIRIRLPIGLTFGFLGGLAYGS